MSMTSGTNGGLKVIQKSTLKAWDKFMDTSNYLLRPIENDKHYEQVASFLDSLLDQARASASTEALIDYVTQLIADYDQKLELPEADPKDVLAFLMEQHHLKQKDLNHLIPQAILSQLLNGKRPFSTNHAKKLAKFFNVSATAFI
jgi:HTH-type transcriptional regulator / antitoxin HigA